MDNQKIYLMAEVTVLPEFLDDVKGALKEALIPTLQEAGCEGMFETSREGDPHKLVFFEIFSSLAAHKFHLEQDYMKHWKASWLKPSRQLSLRALRRGLRTAESCSLALAFTTCRKIIPRSSAPLSMSG